MKKYLLAFAIALSLLSVPVNAYAVGRTGEAVDGINQELGEAALGSTEDPDQSNLDRYLDGDSSVDTEHVDEPAEDTSHQRDYDMVNALGQVIEGQFNFSYCDPNYNNDRYNWYVKYLGSGLAKSFEDGSCLYFIKDKHDLKGYKYILYCSYGNKDAADFGIAFGTDVRYTVWKNKDDPGPSPADPRNFEDGTNTGYLKLCYWYTDCPFSLITDIPIFDKESSTFENDLNAYLQTGDVSHAENADFVATSIANSQNGNVEADGSIPTPLVNALYTFDSNSEDVFKPRKGMSVLVDTSQEAASIDNLAYDIQVGAQCKNKADGDFTLSYKYFYNGKKIEPGSSGLIFDSAYLFNDVSTWIHSVSDLKIVQRLYVRVRFRQGNKASNWVQIVFANGSSASTAYEQTPDNDYVSDGDYTGGMLDGDTSSGFNAGGLLSNNVGYMYDFVRGGFGLLDGGLISLLANTFRYIPASIWDLIKTYISSVIIITMIVLTINALAAVASAVAGIFGKGSGM